MFEKTIAENNSKIEKLQIEYEKLANKKNFNPVIVKRVALAVYEIFAFINSYLNKSDKEIKEVINKLERLKWEPIK